MNLYEVVFESVDRNSLLGLLTAIVANSDQIMNINCTNNIVEPTILQIRSGDLIDFLQVAGDACIFIKLLNVGIGRAMLPSVMVRCVKYEQQFDLDFSFELDDSDDIKAVTLMKKLHDGVVELAKDVNIESFFGGMEPASDKETRYFTNHDFREF
jgi:hypothetical protein